MTGITHSGTVRWLYAPVLFLLPLTTLSIHLFGFKRMYDFTRRMAIFAAKRLPSTRIPMSKAEQVAQTITLVNRRLSFYQASCLAESLLLWGILQCYGIGARFCLGVRTITGPLDAHAWVSYQGRILNDIQRVQSIYATFDLGYLKPGSKQ